MYGLAGVIFGKKRRRAEEMLNKIYDFVNTFPPP